MSYLMLEELQSRAKEKVAAFMTAENLVGMLAMVGPTYVITTAIPNIVIQGVLLLAAAASGIILTSDFQGTPLYQRLLWRVRGHVRRKLRGAVLTPEDFTGVARQRATRRMTRVGSAVTPTTRTSQAVRLSAPAPAAQAAPLPLHTAGHAAAPVASSSRPDAPGSVQDGRRTAHAAEVGGSPSS